MFVTGWPHFAFRGASLLVCNVPMRWNDGQTGLYQNWLAPQILNSHGSHKAKSPHGGDKTIVIVTTYLSLLHCYRHGSVVNILTSLWLPLVSHGDNPREAIRKYNVAMDIFHTGGWDYGCWVCTLYTLTLTFPIARYKYEKCNRLLCEPPVYQDFHRLSAQHVLQSHQ